MAEKNFRKSNKVFQKALFLDRDGVINIERGTFTWKKADFQLLRGILKLTKFAQEKGYKLVIITNQSGIARRLYNHKDVEILHEHMLELFAGEHVLIDGIYYCPHHPEFTGKCFCRKPGHLMLERAIGKFQIDPHQSFMLGDKERDLIAGKNVGCKTVRVGEGEPIFPTDISVGYPDELIPYL
jgi:D-glycero-D-manno-heptose 1,7-bisphosphate phosphatase